MSLTATVSTIAECLRTHCNILGDNLKNGQVMQLNSIFLVTLFARFAVRWLHVYPTDVRAKQFPCGPMETHSPSQITVF